MTDTPSQAEREVERARADLSRTLDELKDRLSFTGLADEVRHQFAGTGGSEFASNLSRQLRERPLPAALVGLGVLWMMMGERGGHARAPTGRFYSEAERAGGFTEGMTERMEGMGERARHAASEMGGEAAERARAAAAGAGEAMHAFGDRMSSAGHSATEWMHSASEAVQSAGASAGRMGQRTTQSLNEMLEQQPLLSGAMGLAIGALIGAMLPKTRMESEYLGETGEQLRDVISEQGAQLYEKGKVTATEVYRAAAEEARAQGLMPEGGGETLAEKAEHVLRRAGETAKEVGRREFETPQEEGHVPAPSQPTGRPPAVPDQGTGAQRREH